MDAIVSLSIKVIILVAILEIFDLKIIDSAKRIIYLFIIKPFIVFIIKPFIAFCKFAFNNSARIIIRFSFRTTEKDRIIANQKFIQHYALMCAFDLGECARKAENSNVDYEAKHIFYKSLFFDGMKNNTSAIFSEINYQKQIFFKDQLIERYKKHCKENNIPILDESNWK